MAGIGFIGTGIMGGHMARRLAGAGHAVRAWNRTAEKAQALADAGVEAVASAADAAAGAEAVMVMLGDGPTCDAVLLEGGRPALAAMGEGALLVVMSSIPVETARGQAEAAAGRGVLYLDAPVSGGERGARDGGLVIMAGGEPAAFEKAKPLFAPLGRATLVGPAGCGQLAKLANQLIVANTIATVAEALLLAERGGADPAAVREALLGGFADSTVLRQHGERMLKRDFAPGGPVRHQLKDVRTVMDLAEKLGLDLPLTAKTTGLFADLAASGGADLDHSALYLHLARKSGMA
ncbi:MAG: NAD(P)-dependent oxidoreductase [Geminicoccaceae bacterium]|nr:NAD(P)-dependent oxidoreductase [Geminicoccaceae bacterium]